MMAHYLLHCVWALAMLSLSWPAVSGETYYVTPTASTSCPEEGVPCYNLSEYATKPDNYFASNTTFILLSGNHSLNSELWIRNITSLVMTANSLALVSCTDSGRLKIESIEQVSVRDLEFFGCVNNSISSVDRFTLENCTLHGQQRYGTGLQMNQVASADIIGSSFIVFTGYEGGAIVVDSCNVSITGSSFEGNSAVSGGGVYVTNSDIIIDNCLFIGIILNKTKDYNVESGGALNAVHSNVSVNNTLFVNNTVTRSFAGAVCVSESEIAILNSNFSGNTADNGEIFAAKDRSHVTISSGVFINNSGSNLIVISSSSKLTTNGFLDIRNNTAAASVVRSELSTIHFSGNVSLSHNSGVEMLFIISSDLSSTGILHIHNNKGTALYSVRLNFKAFGISISGNVSTIDFRGGVSLFNNSGPYALYISSSILTTGGHLDIQSNVLEQFAVRSINGTLHFSGNVSLSHNFANVSLIRISSFTNLSTADFFNVHNNTAGSDAVMVSQESMIHFGGNVSVSHNLGDSVIHILYGSYWTATGFLYIQNHVTFRVVVGEASRIDFRGNVSLTNNYELASTLIISDTNLTTTGFLGIQNNEGAALLGIRSIILLSGNVSLSNNSMSKSNVFLYSTNAFFSFSIFRSSLIYIESSDLSTTGFLDIQKNGVPTRGFNSTLHLGGNISLSHNNGGLEMYLSTVTVSGTASFKKNSSPLSVYQSSSITLIGDIRFMNNTGGDSQGVILLSNSRLNTHGNINISNNIVSLSGGGIYAFQSELNFRGRTIISGNKAGENGGGISAVSTTITLYEGVLRFIGNSAKRGGGLYLESDSRIYLRKARREFLSTFNKWLRLEFAENSADYGGAMQVNVTNSGACASHFQREPSQLVDTECFLQTVLEFGSFFTINSTTVIQEYYRNTLNVQNTFFTNNTAKVAGQVLYGGLLDRCTLNRFSEIRVLGFEFRSSLEVFASLTETEEKLTSTTTVISSEPVRVYFCTNGKPNKTYIPHTVYVKKGRTFKIPVVAVDQAENPVIATIRSSTESGQLDRGQANQQIKATCTDLEYRVFSPNSTETIYLYADGPCNDIGVSRSSIDIQFESCPIGFEESENGCDCDSCLSSNMFITNCSIDTESVQRRDTVWIAIDDTPSQLKYIIHPNCPFDYCRPSTEQIYINLNSPNGSDIQCAFDRSGKLCGSCKDGLSLSLGSSRCKTCSNGWLALIIVFSLIGIALVIFILTFNLTVAVGTINGLIFYANIIAANRAVFLPFDSPNIFTIFIAWLNLDFGFETCFYDGLDGYSKTWLQFVFPAYVLFLVAMVILFANISQRFAKLLSNRNPVAALATLILLSYTKLLRTVIAALSFALLDYRTANSECESRMVTVWLVDANIVYFEGKHIPLLIMAIAVILVGLMFTFLLLLWQWLQHCPSKWCFSWIWNAKLRAFMDAYLAPYSPKYRFWPGLLLLVRVLLYLIVSANDGRKSITLLMVICLTGGLIFLNGSMKNKVYKNWLVNALESSFIFNLVIFAAATGFIKQAEGNQEALAYTSTSIAFITFLAILVYHLIDSFKSLKNIATMTKENEQVNKIKAKMANIQKKSEKSVKQQELKVNKAFIELRESMLADPTVNVGDNSDKQPALPLRPLSPTHTEIEGIGRSVVTNHVTVTVVNLNLDD